MRLPAVLLDHLAGRSAPGGPRRVRRHPRRGQALVRRGSGRRRAHRPPGRIVRSGRLSDVAARDHRAAGVDRHREDPRRRRTAGSDPAGGGHHRLRRAARDRRLVHRSRGRGPAHRPRRFDRLDYATMPQLARTLKVRAVTDTLAQRAGPAVPRHRGRDRSDAIPNCPTPSPPCSATSTCIGRTICTCRRCLPTALAETVTARPELAEPLAVVAGRGRRWRRGGGAPAAVVRGGDGEVDGGLPVLPRPTPGVAQRGRRRARPLRGEPGRVPPAGRGARRLVAAGDDGVDHPRHQARRRRAGPDRGAVTGAVAVGGVRRRVGATRSRRPTR